MSWFKAKDHCEGNGGKLVEIDSEEENTALVEEINRKGYKSRNMNFWIGLTDKRNEGDWRLASNDLKPSFRKWAEGEPEESFGRRLCIAQGWANRFLEGHMGCYGLQPDEHKWGNSGLNVCSL